MVGQPNTQLSVLGGYSAQESKFVRTVMAMREREDKEKSTSDECNRITDMRRLEPEGLLKGPLGDSRIIHNRYGYV